MKDILIATPDAELLARLGAITPPDYNLIHAGDGIHALERLDTTRLDLIVVDLWMPEVDGFQVLGALTRNHPGMPVVALGRYASRTLNIRLRETGGLRVACHPVKPETLLGLIDELLAQREGGGKLPGVSLSAFLHLIDMEKRSCHVNIRDRYHGRDGWLEVFNSQLRAAGCDDGSASQAAALQILTWDSVTLDLQELEPEQTNAGLAIDLTDLMVEGVKYRERALLLRRRDKGLGTADAGGVSEILQEVVTVPGVRSALLIARDGFVIDGAGQMDADPDIFGAATGVLLTGAEGMIGELVLSYFESLVLEHEQAQIVCGHAGNSMLVVVADPLADNSPVTAALPNWGARIARLL